jgi:3-deoxy-D-manno-octulosonic acid (KDO) 8-phosphate synthase
MNTRIVQSAPATVAGAIAPNAVVRVSDRVVLGNDLPIAFICGPCQLESRAHALESADFIRSAFEKLGAPVIYKTSFDKANRSIVLLRKLPNNGTVTAVSP